MGRKSSCDTMRNGKRRGERLREEAGSVERGGAGEK